jgi:glycosyltransferase involved in cell wall biosynthesis
MRERCWPVPEEAHVVPHIMRPAAIGPARPVWQTERVILAVGNVGFLKGSDIVVRAAATVGELKPLVRFVGGADPSPGWEETSAQLTTLAEDLNVQVEYLGYRSRREVADSYEDARVVVVASRLESFSWIVLEAAAAGRPVLVSEGAGASELSGAGKFFSTFPVGDVEALAALLRPPLTDPEYAQRRGEDAAALLHDEEYKARIREGWNHVLAAAVGQ